MMLPSIAEYFEMNIVDYPEPLAKRCFHTVKFRHRPRPSQPVPNTDEIPQIEHHNVDFNNYRSVRLREDGPPYDFSNVLD
jgi:hypothetical protein